MCFRINRDAIAPKRRVAYKVVCRQGRRRRSWWGGSHRPKRTKYYPIGAVVKANRAPRSIVAGLELQAHSGIYVYLTLATAKRFARGEYDPQIIAVQTNPADFLFASYADEKYPAATYRKVKVLRVVQ